MLRSSILQGHRWVFCWLATLSLVFTVSADETPTKRGLDELGVDALVHELRHGDLVLFLRHAKTDHSQIDSDRHSLDNCETQRNLNDEGRVQARSIGEAIRALEIPIGRVLASPYCRCRETARLAFGSGEINEHLRFGVGADAEETTSLALELRRMLSTPPDAGTNTVLISHTANLKEATGIWPKPEGSLYVFRPNGSDGFEYLGRIAPDAWGSLTAFREE